MSKLIEITLDDNSKIYLEAVSENMGMEEEGLFANRIPEGRIIQKTKSFLDGTFNQIKAFSSNLAESFKSLEYCPDEIEVDFAVKFSADAGVIISSISSEASITVKLKWNKS